MDLISYWVHEITFHFTLLIANKPTNAKITPQTAGEKKLFVVELQKFNILQQR